MNVGTYARNIMRGLVPPHTAAFVTERKPHEAVISPTMNPGIALHSGSSDYEIFRIFAVSSLLKAAEFRAWALDRRMRFKSLLGSWEGVQEPCFIIYEGDTGEAYPWFADQKATLHLGPAYREGRRHGSRVATTYWAGPDGTVTETPCGLFVDAPRDWAILQDSWTFDPTRNAFTLCIPEGTPLAEQFISPASLAPAGTEKPRPSLTDLFDQYGRISGLRGPDTRGAVLDPEQSAFKRWLTDPEGAGV